MYLGWGAIVPGHGQAVGAVHAVDGDGAGRAIDVCDLGGRLQEAVGERRQAAIAKPVGEAAQGRLPRRVWNAPCSGLPCSLHPSARKAIGTAVAPGLNQVGQLFVHRLAHAHMGAEVAEIR